jgi:acyl-coenzyme A thioesterase PaaI-like protein
MPDAPEGFEQVRAGGEFIGINGPLWLRVINDTVQLGMRVEPRHTNGMLICHGGMIATFCDMLMPLTARRLSED